MHTHEFQGQNLRHDHPGGELPHGYFEHAEDVLVPTIEYTKVGPVMGTQATADLRVTYTYNSADYTEDQARERVALMLAGRVDNPDFPALAVDTVQAGQRPELRLTGTVEQDREFYPNSISTAEDYARYAAQAMNAATAHDTEFIADGATVTAYVHCLAHMSATFELDESRPYPGGEAPVTCRYCGAEIEPVGSVWADAADPGPAEPRYCADSADHMHAPTGDETN